MKGSITTIAALTVALSGNLLLASPAHADWGGAGGNSNGSGSGDKYARATWTLVTNGWRGIKGYGDGDRGTFYNRVKYKTQGGDALAQYCVDSPYIIYQKGNWVGPGQAPTSNRPDTAEGMIEPVRQALYRLGIQNYNFIICLQQKDIMEYGTDDVYRTIPMSTQADYVSTQPYAYVTSIENQIKNRDGSDPIGKNNLHDQTGDPVYTKFSEVYENLKKQPNMTPDDLRNRVNQALSEDARTEHSKVNLDDKNKEGFAEGGVLNVSEQTTYATVRSFLKTQGSITQKCRQNWQRYPGGPKEPTSGLYNCYETSRIDNVYQTSVSSPTTFETGFWQMISVHCNLAQFKALLDSDASIQSSQTNDDGTYSAVAYTKVYKASQRGDGSWSAARPSALDFGDTRNSEARKAATGSLGFFDKECPFSCTDSTNTTPSANGGASGANGATSNNTTVSKDGTNANGAVSDSLPGNIFQVFRDNNAKKITLNVWYPKSSGVVSYNGSAPLTTTVSRWSQGTPGVNDTDGGGKFTMKTGDGATTLFSGSQGNLTQKNWDTTTFSNSNATILPGLVRDFTVQSTWASDANKPQVLNVKWEYAPSVSTRFSTNNIGFAQSSDIQKGTINTVSTDIQGKCYLNLIDGKEVNTVDAFQNNTGTGTTNNLDGKLIEDIGGNGSSANTFTTNLVVNFVRATKE